MQRDVRVSGRSSYDRAGTGSAARQRRALQKSLTTLLFVLSLAGTAHAQDATWVGGNSGEWTDGSNWSPTSVPTGTAFFSSAPGATSITNAGGAVSIGTIDFSNAVTSFTVTAANGFSFAITDGGVVGNGLHTENLVVANGGTMTFGNFATVTVPDVSIAVGNGGTLEFLQTSNPGTASITDDGDVEFEDQSGGDTGTITDNNILSFNGNATAGATVISVTAGTGVLSFNDSSSAGLATITVDHTMNFNDQSDTEFATIANNADGTANFFNSSKASSADITNDGLLTFNDTSSAGGATITNNAAGTINFYNSSSASSANITNSGLMTFNDASSAGSATITTNLGATEFTSTSTGGTATLITNALGTVIISGLTTTGMSVGSIEGAGSYILGSKTLSAGGNNKSTTVSGVISDGGLGGSLTKVGTGTLILSGLNTYTGATTISAGTLKMGVADAIADTSGVSIASGATFALGGFDQTVVSLTGLGDVTLGSGRLTMDISADDLFGGVISGAGGLSKDGSATLTLSNNNTYNGSTLVHDGTLAMGTANALSNSTDVNLDSGTVLALNDYSQEIGSLAGSGNVQLGANSTTVLTTNGDGASTEFDGDISGAGGLTKEGTGTLTFGLFAFNTYTGRTTINAGTLEVGGNGIPIGGGGVSIASGATLEVDTNAHVGDLSGAGDITLSNFANLYVGTATATTTFSGVISGGPGAIVLKEGSGTLILTGHNTYADETIINDGTLEMGIANALSSSNQMVVSSGATFDLHGFDQTIDALVGQGDTKLGAATLTLEGVHTASSIQGVISGSGGLTKNGPEFASIFSVNTYTGPTKINDGIVALFADDALSSSTDVTMSDTASLNLGVHDQNIGSLAGGGSVDVGIATLATNGDNASTTFSGVISGSTGGLTKIGTGTFTLNGVNTYTGATTIDGGTLVLGDVTHPTAAITGNAIVNSGGTLKGFGTIGGNLNVNGGGTIAPGNSIGTMTVLGNVSFGPSSTYQVENNASGASDKIEATGSATLSGGTVQVTSAPGNYAAHTTYAILTAGAGVTGSFASVTDNLFFLIPTLVYKPDEVDLVLSPIQLAASATTPNQTATGNGIQDGGTSSTLYLDIVGLSPADTRTALDATSGEIHASMRSVMLEDSQSQRQAIFDHLDDVKDVPGHVFWTHASGHWGSIASDGNAATLDTSTYGITAGGDIAVAPGVRIGVEGGYGNLHAAIGGDRASSMSAEEGLAGVYGEAVSGAFALRLAATGAWGNARTVRHVAFPGFSDTDRAHQTTSELQTVAEASYDASLGRLSLSPFVNAGWTEASTGAFAESGGLAALSGTSGASDEISSTLGFRLSTAMDALGGSIEPNATVGWQHGYSGLLPTRTLNFEATSSSFTIAGVPLDRDEAVIDAGFAAHLGSATINIGYDGILSDRVSDNGVQARAFWNF